MRENNAAQDVTEAFPAALEKEEFVIYYQPKANLKTYTLAGAEALCRWLHDGKMVPPAVFVPVLEESDLICELDFYILEHVCRDLRGWLDEGMEVVRISVNLSRRNLGKAGLVEKIVGVLDRHGVPYDCIELEVLESAADVSAKSLEDFVVAMHKLGISTAVDDFGTGYSSLNLIRKLPWNTIKIDKSLLPETLDKTTEQYTLFSHLLTMLYDMGFHCIVEGVENLDHIKMMKENNCFMAQGFYFDKPLPKADFAQRLEALQERKRACL